MPEQPFQVPILLIVFNRPDTTAIVLEQIRKIQPKFLFIAGDGHRSEKPGEDRKCEEVRDLVKNSIDWDCKVKMLFSEKNMGCKKAPIRAINWFFENVEEGIILEDDCLPSLTFFSYCAQLLERYRNDSRIMAINGCNFGYNYPAASYFFSRYMNVWGWATWRRAAVNISYEVGEWEETNKMRFLKSHLKSKLIDLDKPWLLYWKTVFDDISNGNLNDAWDFFWIYYQFKHRKLNILPSVNLVKNIGFKEGATHTTLLTHPAAQLKINDLVLPIKWNEDVQVNKDYEEKAVKPICYMHNRMPNSFYIKNWLLKFPPVAVLAKMKKRSGL